MRRPASAPVEARFVDSGRRDPSPADSGQLALPSRLEVVRARFEDQDLPKEVVDLLLAGTRPATHSAYQTSWNFWANWCIRNNANPLSSDINQILKFLSDSFLAGKSFSTINGLRSMLSTTLGKIDGFDIGKHPLVVQLLKGVYHSNPPRPKYNATWDVDTVLQFFESAPINTSLDLRALAWKTATLLALVTMFRTSELASIEFSSVSFSHSGVNFSLSRLRKSQRTGPLQSHSIASLDNANWCPVEAIKAYLSATKQFRDVSQAKNLFIGLVKPHRSVTGSTVGHWIKNQLAAAGIDTTTFTAHSTRGASASKAASMGVPISQILKTANWASESTFSRFYR